MNRDVKPRSHPLAQKSNIDLCELFCAYHLGLTADDGYAFQNVHQVAKRFGVGAGVIKQIMQDLAMDSDAMLESSFELVDAQIDLMSAPEGVSRRELGKGHYERFLAAPKKKRDWKRELEDDARANEKTFGPPKAPRGRR